jgi:hypothetical protein
MAEGLDEKGEESLLKLIEAATRLLDSIAKWFDKKTNIIP